MPDNIEVPGKAVYYVLHKDSSMLLQLCAVSKYYGVVHVGIV